MKLQTYLDRNLISVSKFARLVGVNKGAVSRWLSGQRMPRTDALCRIREVTGGKVQPKDFNGKHP